MPYESLIFALKCSSRTKCAERKRTRQYHQGKICEYTFNYWKRLKKNKSLRVGCVPLTSCKNSARQFPWLRWEGTEKIYFALKNPLISVYKGGNIAESGDGSNFITKLTSRNNPQMTCFKKLFDRLFFWWESVKSVFCTIRWRISSALYVML